MNPPSPRQYRTPLPGLFAGALELAINRVLALDENVPERLARLDGRLLEVRLEGVGIDLFLAFTRYRVAVSLEAEREADAVVEGSPVALFTMALPDGGGQWSSPGSGVRISGDAGLARDLERLFSRLEPDWEGWLAGWFGDVLGHQVASGARAAAGQARQALGELEGMTAEYLNRQSSPVARAADLEGFGREVGRLRDATERLEARIRLLAERREAGSADRGDETETPE